MRLFRRSNRHAQNQNLNKKEQNFISKATDDKEDDTVQTFIQKNSESKQSEEDTEQETT